MSSGESPEISQHLARHEVHLRDRADVLAVEARHRLLVLARALRDAADQRGLLPEIARALGRRHDAARGAVALLAAVVEPERLDDPLRGQVLLHRERALVEERARVGDGEVADRDRDVAELLGGGAELVRIAAVEHRHPRGRREQPGRHVPAVVDRVARDQIARDAHAEAVARAPVERAVADDVVRGARGHRHRGLVQRGGRGAAAVVRLADEAQLADPERARELDLVGAVHRERGHAVDLLRIDAAVLDRGAQRLAAELELRALRVLRVLGLADPGDRGLVAQRGGHLASSPWAARPRRCR